MNTNDRSLSIHLESQKKKENLESLYFAENTINKSKN